MSILKESLLDESGKVSSTRVVVLIVTLTGVLVSLVGLVLIACGYKNITAYVGTVIGVAWGSGAAKVWAAQVKSAKVTTTAAKPPKVPGTPT